MNATQLRDTVSTEAEVKGTCDARFQVLYDFFAANLANGQDVGASAAVFMRSWRAAVWPRGVSRPTRLRLPVASCS